MTHDNFVYVLRMYVTVILFIIVSSLLVRYCHEQSIKSTTVIMVAPKDPLCNTEGTDYWYERCMFGP